MIQEFFPVLDGVPMGDLWVLLVWGAGVAVIAVVALWFWIRRSPREGAGNFSFSVVTALLGFFYAVKSDGYGPRRLLMGTLVLIWGAYLLRQFWFQTPSETETEEPVVPSFLSFFLRACLAVFLSTPLAMLAIDPLQTVTGYEWLGLVLWLSGMAGHALDESRRSLFEWLIWIAYCVAALATPYGAWTILCPLVLLYFLRPFTF